MEQSLEQRIARMEAIEEIRQLPVKYALGIDMRDIDAVVKLFVDDGRRVFFRNDDDGVAGGDDLRRSYFMTQSQYSNSQHFVLNHVIEIDDEDHAHGCQYGKVEQEIDDRLWTLCSTLYEDVYERVDGVWLFAERRGRPWYFTSWNEPPVGPNKLRWPAQFGMAQFRADGDTRGMERAHEVAAIPAMWPSWGQFWRDAAAEGLL